LKKLFHVKKYFVVNSIMSVLIRNVEMDKYNECCTPDVITLTFTNGEICSYMRRSIERSNPVGRKRKLLNFTPRKYDPSDEKIDEKTFESIFKNCEVQLAALDKQYKWNVEEAERLYAKDSEKIDMLHNSNKDLLGRLSMDMLREYRRIKKEIHSRIVAANVPAERLRIMVNWLRHSRLDALIKAAEMLECEANYIIKKVKSPDMKHDIFLSHVQKKSTDASRNIKDSLERKGLGVWFDKSVERLDKHGMIDGIVNSSLFTVLLTKEYFQRPYCVFEYCISSIAGKKLITVYEPDPHHGGGRIESFQLPEMFKHIKDHELVELNRNYWEPFITRLQSRIKKTVDAASNRVTMKARSAIARNSSFMTKFLRVWLEQELRTEGRVIGRRLYSASRDGNTSKAFHKKCDGKGATITVVESSTGKVFGGFSSRPWSSTKGFFRADSAWLFKCHDNGQGERININASCRSKSVFHFKFSGPCFVGESDLWINYETGKVKNGCPKLSFTKGILSKNSGIVPFQINDYEVFQILNELH